MFLDVIFGAAFWVFLWSRDEPGLMLPTDCWPLVAMAESPVSFIPLITTTSLISRSFKVLPSHIWFISSTPRDEIPKVCHCESWLNALELPALSKSPFNFQSLRIRISKIHARILYLFVRVQNWLRMSLRLSRLLLFCLRNQLKRFIDGEKASRYSFVRDRWNLEVSWKAAKETRFRVTDCTEALKANILEWCYRSFSKSWVLIK